jgi:UDP-N-acetylglucosamine diphosphorylase / glucose-1-phosphate thymidylyltransferase / UDP-N-acetylgalactosamine diphosphorylase / glucosamine-1-phosphate N-acetyltransferase / galactosamine-1-phosphate N-acetyltransferase
MYRYIIEDTRLVPPFNEPASLLTIGIQPLKIHHEELFLHVLGEHIDLAGVMDSRDELHKVRGESVAYRDSLWFDKNFFEYFVNESRKTGKACRAAFPASDQAFHTYTIPLTKGFQAAMGPTGGIIFLCDLWYFPDGYDEDIIPVIVPSDSHEIGFYSVPDFMTMQQGNLTHFAVERGVISIESWVHIYFATIIFGNFGRAGRLDGLINRSVWTQLKLLWYGVLEQKQVLSSSATVKIGHDCDIDPSAIITGPAEIGDNCSIGAGVIIDNCTIGDNVNIDAGCVLKMSTVADSCFLPFRCSLYLTAVMENTIIAQNTCLQMCVIGRNSFIGAGTTFTDFNLIAQKPMRAANIDGELQSVGQIVLGSAIGHNCRIGSGMIVFPGRMVESDVVLVASPQRRVIMRNITFEESDHHFIQHGEIHKRHYPRIDEVEELISNWDDW